MSETPNCPYCGAVVRTDRALDYDNKVMLRCSNCGGMFEYMPGFGAFSLPEQERTGAIRHEGSIPTYHYEADTPWESETPPGQQGSCGPCCAILFFFCFILPVIISVVAIILGFGWFW